MWTPVSLIGHSVIRSFIRNSSFVIRHSLLLLLVAPALATVPPPPPTGGPLLTPFHFKASNDPIPNAESPSLDTSLQSAGWSVVYLPHTWSEPNGKPTYANAWYRTTFNLNKTTDAGKRIYLRFAGVATIADVYVNGKHLGQHRGAYTAFIFDATDAIKLDAPNLLAVKVSNDPKETADCLPSGTGKQLYKIYGGIYRPAEIIKRPPIHIYPDMASQGVFVTVKSADKDAAEISVRTVVRNATNKPRQVEAYHVINAKQGDSHAIAEGAATIPANGTKDITVSFTIRKPLLWAPSSPARYEASTTILDVSDDGDKTFLDHTTTTTFGIRTIKYNKGQFLLNNQPFYVRGVNKHQETEHHLTAVSNDDLKLDWDKLQDMGVNTVRLAHYPHAAFEYDQADQRGIAVWAENGHSNNAKPSATGELITREMVRQNYNHPAILFWSCGNEAESIATSRYAEIIREEDPSRIVTYASNGQTPRNTDFIAGNTYPGWYGGYYRSFNNKYTSETGAGGSIATHMAYDHATWKVNTFEPEEYQQIFAEQKMQTIFRTPPEAHPMFLWWTFREFGDAKFKGRNSKGILTYAGEPKSIYYLFQSFLRPDYPVLHIASPTWMVRTTPEEAAIKVYSNADELFLSVNGESRGSLRNGNYEQPLLKPNSPATKKAGTAPTTTAVATKPAEIIPTTRLKVDNVFYWADPKLRPGNNQIVVSNPRGIQTALTLYYAGPSTLAAEDPSSLLVHDLKSSNPANPAYFHTEPVHAQWPIYYECDGASDNTFDTLPDELAGAQRILTKRLSKDQNKTDLSFTLSSPATVYLVVSADAPGQAVLKPATAAGFTDTKVAMTWRNNLLAFVPATLLKKDCQAGETVKLAAHVADYAIFAKATK